MSTRWDALTDEELLTAFVERRDREAAFHDLVDRYERRVYSIWFRYFGDHADAQDASQDTFLAIVRNASSFRGGSRLSTWIYRVAVNACNDLARKRSRRPQTPVEDVTAVADEPDEDAFAARETELEVQRALLALDELSRTLVVLVAIEGLAYHEVAEVTDLPVGTVKSRVHRARARLAELLGPLRNGSQAEGTSPPPATSNRADP